MEREQIKNIRGQCLRPGAFQYYVWRKEKKKQQKSKRVWLAMGIGKGPGMSFVLEMLEMFHTRKESPSLADAVHRQSKMGIKN